MKIKEVVSYIESIAPLSYQENYDNAGLLVGNKETKVSGVLISLDITEAVVEEAIKKKANLIIAHHPVIFGGLKKLTGANYVERSLIAAIKNDIAIYIAHTNLDSITGGVNSKICEKIGLKNCKILSPVSNELKKLVFFVPVSHAQKVRDAIFNAGAGHIGNYDMCSFNLDGKGTFRAGEGANPFVGNIGTMHTEEEVRIETIYPKTLQGNILSAMRSVHPYEEVAYDIYPLDNKYNKVGMGMVGELEQEEETLKFLKRIKKIFNAGVVRYTPIQKSKVHKIAVCGGSGSFLLRDAISANADVFITSDFKYHQFFDAENKLVVADIGHFETEQFTKEIFYDLLFKKFSTFAVCFSEINTNPINYL